MSVEKAVFGTLPDGREVPVYTLKNAGGMTLGHHPIRLPDCAAVGP